jgi:hypothetical protein
MPVLAIGGKAAFRTMMAKCSARSTQELGKTTPVAIELRDEREYLNPEVL